jgi:hypothetical protein
VPKPSPARTNPARAFFVAGLYGAQTGRYLANSSVKVVACSSEYQLLAHTYFEVIERSYAHATITLNPVGTDGPTPGVGGNQAPFTGVKWGIDIFVKFEVTKL